MSTFRCVRCGEDVSWNEGADDTLDRLVREPGVGDDNGLCADCWCVLDAVELAFSEPAGDGYRTVVRGETCPKCGKPGNRRTKHIGSIVQVWMVHSTTGNGWGGCILREGLSDTYVVPTEMKP